MGIQVRRERVSNEPEYKGEIGAHFRTALHFRFDKSKEMFLVHTTGVMDVGVDFAQIIKVSIRRTIPVSFVCFLGLRITYL